MPKSLNSKTRLPRLESWLFHLDRLLYLLMPQFCHGKMGMLLVFAQLGFCQVKDNAAFLCTVKIKYKNGDQS